MEEQTEIIGVGVEAIANYSGQLAPGDFLTILHDEGAGPEFPWTFIYKGPGEYPPSMEVYAATWVYEDDDERSEYPFVDTASDAYISIYRESTVRRATEAEKSVLIGKLKRNRLAWDADRLQIVDDQEWVEKCRFSKITIGGLNQSEREFLLNWLENRPLVRYETEK